MSDTKDTIIDKLDDVLGKLPFQAKMKTGVIGTAMIAVEAGKALNMDAPEILTMLLGAFKYIAAECPAEYHDKVLELIDATKAGLLIAWDNRAKERANSPAKDFPMPVYTAPDTSTMPS